MQVNNEKDFTDYPNIPIFGYDLIREVVLSDLLGKDSPQLLYWAGKSLARKYPLQTIEELIQFFHNAGWGDLHVHSEKKYEIDFHLTGEIISHRFRTFEKCTFQLEAGFLAQQIQQLKNHITETFEQQKKRSQKVIFTVKWDKESL
ncbi:YslB family protein [Bacillus timonensis]|nr:YslB family protein [Bacillus timonensis]